MKPLLLLASAALAAAPLAAMAARGSDGDVKVLYWQAASTLNPYLSGIGKEVDAAAPVLEPLARFDNSGKLVPWLAESIPTVENGGIAKDLMHVTWVLKKGILWSDGTPLTAHDVVFTWKYCTAPGAGCASSDMFEGIKDVVAKDDRTVEISYDKPKPYPYTAFVSSESPILQERQFKDCLGAKIVSCTAQNFHPIGTGPFVVDEFKPNDVITYSANPHFRDPNKPAFAHLTIKGGGNPNTSALAVLKTGEFDFGWNLQLPPKLLKSMETGGKGEVVTDFATGVEFLFLNQTNPDPSLGDKRSTVAGGPHPFLTDPRVGQALSLAIDRKKMATILYGDAGKPGCNVIPAPDMYRSSANDACVDQNIAKAKQLLDAAGWKPGPDGIREKDGKKLSILFQTSTNSVRQSEQAMIKQWWHEIGVATTLRNINASVFFGGDVGSPDTRQKFYADVEMYTDNTKGEDPESYLAKWTCKQIPGPKTQWQGNDIQRFCSKDYDKLSAELSQAASLKTRGDIVKQMNDLLVQSYTIIPLVHRGDVSGKSKTLAGVKMNGWDSTLWNVMNWHRVKG
ncbi:peptide ABC transporter substrate-binding protein [Acidimangrovimonas sediminis]|uniref:peptide ABC transporter substrate-binding protein n=1 Tax=Acidimangrovimonas sediminis TaxID=2056283 RepID=UPI000C80C1F8|nr:peptide ABC transporter substrate-binding protein [Acidimangrovimonas sediminis]